MFIIKPKLDVTEIEKRIDDYSLFKYYCNNFKSIDNKFKGEFRYNSNDDINPSAIISYYKEKLWYKDFGDPYQDKAYDIYSFIMRKYNINFRDVLNKINQDFHLNLTSNNNNNITNKKYDNILKPKEKYIKTNNFSTIRIKRIKPKKKHIDFWTQYKIKERDVLPILNKFNVVPISHFWIQNTSRIKNKMYVINDLGFSYNYFWYKNILLRKIYLPSKKGSLFFTNCNTLVTQGYQQLPKKGKLLFVTSSLKDVIILYYLGYPAVAPSNENVFLQEHIFEELKNRFDNIILFYDNDFTKTTNWGKLFAQKHSKKYNIPYIMLPDNTEKDPSDFIKIYGKEKLNMTIKEQLRDVRR